MTCICGHQDHDWSTGICTSENCTCIKFEQAIGDNSVIPRHQRYLEQLEKVEAKVKYILENIPETRNMKNKDFVFLYWHLVNKLNIVNNHIIKELADPESIRRCRQLLVQHNFEKYGPTDETHLTEKALKNNATYSYVLEKYL